MSFYSKFASYYEAIFPFSQSVADFLREYSSPQQTCLDVGCGTGHYAEDLAVSEYQVTGIDQIRFCILRGEFGSTFTP